MRFATLLASTVLLACALALPGPALGQSKENLRKLSDAYKLIQDDETAKAVETINAVLEDAPEDSDAAAKALLLRGQAYARGGRHAQALADFNAALWLQGLSSSQREDAVAGRKAALAKLGLGEDSGDESDDTARTASASTPDPAASASRPSSSAGQTSSGAWRTDVQAAQEDTEQESEGSSFFGSLFGGDGEEEEQTASVSEEPEPATTSGWSASTTDLSATAATSSEPSAAPQKPASAASDDGGGAEYRVQIASVGTPEGAETEAERLTGILGDALAGETTNIVRTDTDAGNTYYRILVGPKDSRDVAEELCQMFKSRGVDCLVLTSR